MQAEFERPDPGDPPALREWSRREGKTRYTIVAADPAWVDPDWIRLFPANLADGGRRHFSLLGCCSLIGSSLGRSHGGLLTEPTRHHEAQEVLRLTGRMEDDAGTSNDGEDTLRGHCRHAVDKALSQSCPPCKRRETSHALNVLPAPHTPPGPLPAVLSALRALQAVPQERWPARCCTSLASTLLAAILLSPPAGARSLVDWAWRHSALCTSATLETRGAYPALPNGSRGCSLSSSYLRRDAVRELVTAAIWLLRHREARNNDSEALTHHPDQVDALHDALLGSYQVMSVGAHLSSEEEGERN